MYGYMGKILRINLTTSTITEEFPDEETLRKYLGGAGLATKILLEETEKGIDLLSCVLVSNFRLFWRKFH